ncbi:MAG: ABC transporter permease [Deltaproteobacteria bacterium]|nr:ABC transporter permease [Deltaproteobacteria bacterium]
MPRQFSSMVKVELLKVFTRGSGIGTLVVSALVAAFVTLLTWKVSGWQDGMSFNGQPVRGLFAFDVVTVGAWVLYARSLVVIPFLLLLATASAVAGEHADRTLRELAVRPVPRWSILAAKSVALAVLSACSVAITFTVAISLGWVLLGPPAIDQAIAEGDQSLARLALGYAASFFSDLALVAIGMALSVFVRSVGGVVVSIILLLIADRVLWAILALAGFLGVEVARDLVQWTLVAAMGCWKGWDGEFLPSQFAIVGLLTALAWGVAGLRFGRVDVP